MNRVQAEQSWSMDLSRMLGRSVEVRFGRARRNLIVARPKETQAGWRGPLHLRLNYMAADAPPEVRADVAAWLKNGGRARAANARLQSWIEGLTERLSKEPLPLPPLRPEGDVHDLTPLAAELMEQEFQSTEPTLQLPPSLTWGRRTLSSARHTLQLGSFEGARRLVRLHPVLDQEAVPVFFVRYVLFHELLHAAFGKQEHARHHSPAFRRREKLYADYPAALLWQKKNISRMLRSAKSGKPLRRFRIPGFK